MPSIMGLKMHDEDQASSIWLIPEYIEEIIEILKEKDWIIHNFGCESQDDLLNPANYLHNKTVENYNYQLGLDLNIYQFLLNSVKKGGVNTSYQAAAALINFCQISEIEIDPTFCSYEKYNHIENNLEETISNLDLFHRINNSNPDELAKYALGYTEKPKIIKNYDLAKERILDNMRKYERLKGWRSLYLLMLAIIKINTTHTNNHKKLEEFISWSISEYRLSLFAIVYAAHLFGKTPLKRMMKYKPSAAGPENKRNVENMTWDLYIMSQFFERRKGKNKTEYMLASDDKAFCNLLRTAINVQKTNSLIPLEGCITKESITKLQEKIDQRNSHNQRAYNSINWGPEHRDMLIINFEKELFHQPNSS